MEREITFSQLEQLDPQIPAQVFESMENVNADTVIACKKKCHPPFFGHPGQRGRGIGGYL